MSGDLRAVLEKWADRFTAKYILDTLAAADEPLTTTVECPMCEGQGYTPEWVPCDCHGDPGTVRIVAMTEDVLRERLRDVEAYPWSERVIDAIVRALFGEATDE